MIRCEGSSVFNMFLLCEHKVKWCFNISIIAVLHHILAYHIKSVNKLSYAYILLLLLLIIIKL